MGINRKKQRKKNPVKEHKNKLRGLIGEARSAKIYNDEPERKRDRFDNKFSQELLNVRGDLPVHYLDGYLDWSSRMITNLLPNRSIIDKPTYRTLSLLNESKIIPAKSELTWIVSKINKSVAKIKFFLQRKINIESRLWANDYNGINEELECMASEMGQSIWLLEAKIGFSQIFKGLESQKLIYNNIKSESGVGFVRFISHRISLRNEPAVTMARYKASILAVAEDNIDNPDLSYYIKYKLYKEMPSSSESALSILRFSQNFSDIDIYETLIDISQHFYSNNIDSSFLNILLSSIANLEAPDYRIDKVLGNYKKFSNIRSENFDYLEGLLNRNREKTNELSNNSPSINIFRLILQALDPALPDNKTKFEYSFQDAIRRDLNIVFYKKKEFTSARNRLEKTLINLNFLPSCKAIFSSIKIDLFSKNNSFVNEANAIAIETSDITPFDYFVSKNISINSSTYENIFYFYRKLFCSDEEISKPKDINIISYEFINLIFNIRNNDNIGFFENLSLIKNNPNYHLVKNIIAPSIISSYLDIGNIGESISTVSDYICDESFPPEILSSENIITTRTKWPQLRKYSHDISLIIFLDYLYKNSPNDDISTLRRIAIDNYLSNNNLNKPSEIVDNQDVINKAGIPKIIYFFKNICTPTVLEMCRCLNKGSKYVEEERRKILGSLLQLDAENSDVYQDEILDISSNLRIREGLKVVDASRLYVDTEGLTRWSYEEQSENLNRYKSLVEAGVGVAEKIETMLKSVDQQNNSEKMILTVPENEADELLFSMFRDLKDAFLFDDEYGLNSYLSKRIRHNSISGYLRGALESEELITLKDSTGKYIKNSTWYSKLHGYDETEIKRILKNLEKFGSDFDNLTDFIKNELIHIKTNEKPNGIIDIDQNLFTVFFHVMRSLLQQNNFSLEAWVDMSCSLYWHMIESSLQNLRDQLTKNYKEKFTLLFDTLKTNIISCSSREISTHEIFTSINNASRELQVLLDRTAEWLKKGQSELLKYTYNLNEIIDISVRAASIRHKGCHIKLSQQIDESIILRADSLIVLSDILLVVIGNISEHSGCRSSDELYIEASFSKDRSRLAFSFISKVSSNKITSDSIRHLDTIRNEIMSGNYLQTVSKEGKSGLKKIASIVKPDHGGVMEFGYIGDDAFSLDIELIYTGRTDAPYKKLEVKHEYIIS